MAANIEIVKLPVDAWREYRDLRLRALKEEPEAFTSAYLASTELPETHWRQRLADAQRAERSWLLFAKEEGRLVGMLGAYVDEKSTDSATIVSVFVPREERGRGISSLLMAAILQAVSGKRHLHKARLDVNAGQERAVALYLRFGFRETGRKPVTSGSGNAAIQIEMERPLPFRPADEVR